MRISKFQHPEILSIEIGYLNGQLDGNHMIYLKESVQSTKIETEIKLLVKKLKELEEENRRLKRMYADISLDHALLKEVLEKKF